MIRALALLTTLCFASSAMADGYSFPLTPTRPAATIGAGGSQLPACSAATKGTMYIVSDALTPVAIATAVGGGVVSIGVTCNGTNWIVE